jgi:YVTN family beta-propeller protein
MKTRVKFASLLLAAALGAGCAGRMDSVPLTQSSFGDANARIVSATTSNTCQNGQALFVPNFNTDTVSVFDTGTGALRATFTGGGLSGPSGAAYNPINNLLYVPNWWTTTISVFNASTGAPAGLITNGSLVGPYGATVDANGKLYVANNGSTTVSIFDTAHNNAVLTPITGLNGPGGVAVNASRLYVTNFFGNSVSIFDTTKSNAAAGSISGLTRPFGATLAGTKLYVANESINAVAEFDTANNNAAVATLQNNGLNAPFGLASDNATLYAIDAGSNAISKFSLSNNAATGQITGGGLSGPYGAAVGCAPPAGSGSPTPPPPCPNAVYVANYGSNSVSIIDAASHVQLGTLTGGGLNGPTGVGYDRTHQQLFVTNWTNDTVSVFNAATNAPLGVISGNGMDAPYGAAVGNEGRLYVASLGSSTGPGIARFDTNNSYKPLAAMASSKWVSGVAVGVGRLYASNYFANTIDVFDTTNNDARVTTITNSGLNKPFGLAAVGLNVYVANLGTSTLAEFDSAKSYAFVRTLTGNGLSSPYGLAFDATTIYAVDTPNTLSDFAVSDGSAQGTISGDGLNAPYGVATGLACGVVKKTSSYARTTMGVGRPLLETELANRHFGDVPDDAGADPRRAQGPAAFLRDATPGN